MDGKTLDGFRLVVQVRALPFVIGGFTCGRGLIAAAIRSTPSCLALILPQWSHRAPSATWKMGGNAPPEVRRRMPGASLTGQDRRDDRRQGDYAPPPPRDHYRDDRGYDRYNDQPRYDRYRDDRGPPRYDDRGPPPPFVPRDDYYRGPPPPRRDDPYAAGPPPPMPPRGYADDRYGPPPPMRGRSRSPPRRPYDDRAPPPPSPYGGGRTPPPRR